MIVHVFGKQIENHGDMRRIVDVIKLITRQLHDEDIVLFVGLYQLRQGWITYVAN